MAKKLNKKVAFTLIVVLGIGFIGATIFGFQWLRERNPEYCLEKARLAVKTNDFESADRFYSKAYGYSTVDERKIEILFEMSEVHLTVTPEHEPKWRKAIACWNTVLNIDPQHIKAREKLLDYFYQVGDSGGQTIWKLVDEHATKLQEIYQKTGQPPVPTVLIAKARACLELARRGGETGRDELVAQSLNILDQLKELTPDDAQIYRYISEAMLLKGELDEAKGVQDARKNARRQVQTVLTEAIQTVTEKGDVTSYLMEMEFNQTYQDPNLVPQFRKKMEESIQTYPDSDLLYALFSTAYELHSPDMDRRQELELAVKYIEKAQESAGGQNVRYAIRNAMLLRRIGLLYEDTESIERALKIAKNALEFPDSIIVVGPKEGIARQNRYELQSFMARCYTEQAITARLNKDEQAAKKYSALAGEAVNEIVQLAGGSTTLPARQWQGMLCLANGDEKEAYRILYKVYQEQKALDKTGELSAIDSNLCYILSRLAAAQGSMGLQREFLEKAISNRSSIAVERPAAILDYVNILLSLQAGNYAGPVLDTYARLYGENDEITLMRAQADIQSGKFEAAEKRLEKIKTDDARVLQIRLMSVNSQLNQLLSKQALSSESLLSVEQNQIKQLQAQQARLLSEMVKKDPSQVNPQIFVSVCRSEIAQGRVDQARELISSFAAAQPDNIGIQILKLELAEPNPAEITPARREELAETALMQMKDPVQKAFMLAQHYRSLGKTEQAKEQYVKAYSQSPQDNNIAGGYFSFLLDQKDLPEAENVFSKIRDKNPDGYEGNLFAAQLEMAKGNYPAALRRLDECNTIRPGSASASMVKCQLYLLQKNYDAAVESARSALQTDLQNPTAARLLASALYERNRNLSGPATAEQTAELERALGVAIFLNPGDWQLQSAYTEITQEKDPQRALAVRQVLLKSKPNVTNALMLGNMAMRMAQTEVESAKQKGLLDIAGDAYQQAIQMEPDNKLVKTTYAEYLRVTRQQKKAEEIFAEDKDMLWRFYLSDGQYARAAEIIETLLQTQKDNVEALQGLADAYQGMGQRDKIKIPIDRLSQLTLTADQEIWLIQKYLDTSRSEEGKKRLASFQERYPADDRGDLLMAWLNMYDGNTENALALIQKYLEKNPGSDSGWRIKGRIHRLMNQTQQAIDALQRSKSLSPNPTVRMELATVYMQTNQTEAAIGELVSGLDDPQVPPRMLQMLESLYMSRGMGNELFGFYQTMMNKYPNSPLWLTKAGTFLIEMKRYDDAIPMLEKVWQMSRETNGEASSLNIYLKALTEAKQTEKALTLANEYVNTPLAPVAYCNIAAIQANQGQKDKAIDSFAKAIEKSSANQSMLASTLSVMGRVLGTEYVENWCSQKLTADPKYMLAHIIMGNIEEQRGAYQKAIVHVEACLEQMSPNSPEWLEFTNQKATLLVDAYVKTADSKYLNQAIEQLEIILKVQPGNAEILNNLAYLMVDNNVQIEKAVEYSRRAFQASPSNPVFLDTHAYALCKSGKFAEAERYLRQTIQLHEQEQSAPAWDVYKHLGMALEGQKKNEEAVAAYEKSLELGKDIPEKEKAALTKMIQNLKP